MALTPGHGHEALRRGRWSTPSAEYFLTFCTKDRRPGLIEPPIATALLDETQRLEVEDAWRPRTAVVMPDHLHLLVWLGERTPLSAAVRLFKGRLTPVLRSAGLQWQRAYFDHRLRPDEDRLPVFLYVFLNPHRARLIAADHRWPAYFCHPEDQRWFEPLTNGSCPFPEWLS